jgi:magnesium transporter
MTYFAGPAPPGSRLTARDLMVPPDATVSAGTTVAEVIEILLTRRARHLVVTGDEGRCLAVLGPRQSAVAHHLHPRQSPDTPVEALESDAGIALVPDDDIARCAQILVDHDLDAVPVLDEERHVLGLVTVHAAVHAAVYPSASAEARPAA